MVGRIGLDATLRIIEAVGGCRLDVPMKVRPGHWLVELIGEKAARTLTHYYAGEKLEVPRATFFKCELRRIALVADAKQGMSQSELARKYGMTQRTVRITLRAKGLAPASNTLRSNKQARKGHDNGKEKFE